MWNEQNIYPSILKICTIKLSNMICSNLKYLPITTCGAEWKENTYVICIKILHLLTSMWEFVTSSKWPKKNSYPENYTDGIATEYEVIRSRFEPGTSRMIRIHEPAW
jgi:hypothetical protein